jgi:TPR repeat protein
MPDLALSNPDPQEAMRWARRAAEAGEPVGWHETGYFLANGVGAARNEPEAARAYEQALSMFTAENDFGFIAEVKHKLGFLYTDAKGLIRDNEKGLRLLRESADAGHAMAMVRLGYMNQHGVGITRDYQKAYEYYTRAAQAGVAEAETNIGTMIEQGQGFRADRKMALEWYRTAASHGEPVSTYNVGLYYENGWGVTQNLVMAAEWYRKAAELGNEDAKQKLR